MEGNRGLVARGVLAAAAVTVAAAGAWVARDVRAALGSVPRGSRAERVRRSPQFAGGAFRNRMPAAIVPPGAGGRMLAEMLFGRQRRKPAVPVPVVTQPPGASAAAAPAGLHATWLGHATTLVEIEGRRVLFDPVWSDRCTPVPLVGPKRMHPMPMPLTRVPHLDAVVISHDHYDHLDMPTIRTLTRTRAVPFVVPLGIGAHLEKWGVPASRIVELDWDEHATVAGLRFTATAARHFSGRSLRRNPTLWSSWVVAGHHRRVFYTGDTGYFDGYSAIGALHGPFDLTLIQIGAYSPAWPDIHMTPEEAVTAHRDLRGDVLIPVHWGTFTLSYHGWSEPVERLWREAKSNDVRLAVPRPGERVDIDDPGPVDAWWQTVAAS
ncbi:MBL fold metallo-hydrolase [Spongiactinospora sp. TRM90649]|uniref:MBL fold metallo-hydrolase n=1 Tax=Spongiactinospora sp. TRM90649 TaxID=3031114 RepID=UPI0023F9F206|nr:MBL fold metallo-hydrolase [Spongiactinospora sp. TRM90649]MDF5752213.1 MBL fold metallo-hydrolase [Spongiactinospora sp. TRM90649]